MGPRTSPRTQHRPQGCHFVINCARPSPRRELPRAMPGLMCLCIASAPPLPTMGLAAQVSQAEAHRWMDRWVDGERDRCR